ncbi:MAG: hypothetical protein FWE40_03965 [Oscillospiraceae bacterium]|nr:hypothetical protein [Oscillospiraceae bacterium]
MLLKKKASTSEENTSASDLGSPEKNRDASDATFHTDIRILLKTRYENKEKVKKVYSYVLLALTGIFSINIVVMLWFLVHDPENLTAFITAIGVLLSTLVGALLLVVKYLFNSKDDKVIIDQLSEMRGYDAKVREDEQKAKKEMKTQDDQRSFADVISAFAALTE